MGQAEIAEQLHRVVADHGLGWLIFSGGCILDLVVLQCTESYTPGFTY